MVVALYDVDVELALRRREEGALLDADLRDGSGLVSKGSSIEGGSFAERLRAHGAGRAGGAAANLLHAGAEELAEGGHDARLLARAGRAVEESMREIAMGLRTASLESVSGRETRGEMRTTRGGRTSALSRLESSGW